MAKTNPKTDHDDIITGLRMIRDRHHLVAIDPANSLLTGKGFDLSDELERQAMLHWVERQQSRSRNVYFHANPVRAGFAGTKADKTGISVCTHAQLDLDPDSDPSEDFQIRRDRVKFIMKQIVRDYPPSVIIDSGNGFNILWKLEQPMSVAEYEPLNKAFNEHYGAKGTFNADRILKVPGTIAFSGPTKIQKGYPEKSQANLVSCMSNKTTFGVLPKSAVSQGTGSHVPVKGSRIPLPTGISQHEKDKLRDFIKSNADLRKVLEPGRYPDQSLGLEAVAGACIRGGLDRLDYSSVVWLADRSDAHQHLMRQQDKDRALGRAWDAAIGVPAKEQFGAIDDPNAVPPKKMDPDDLFDADDGLSQHGLLGMKFPTKRAYVEQWTLEGVRLFGGSQKSGKSWLFLQEAQAVAEGQPDFLGMKVHRGRVMYAGLEDGDRRLADRLRSMGTSPCDDIRYWRESWSQNSGAGNLAVLERYHDRFPFDVVYIDTMKYWFGTAGSRLGTAYDQSVEDMKPLVKFCQSKHIALCLTTHLRKDKRGLDDWQDMFQGSIGALATVDTLTMLSRMRGTNDAVLHRSGRDLDAEDDIAIQWNDMPTAWGLSPHSAASVAAVSNTRPNSMKQKIVLDLQQNGPQSTKADILLRTGGSRTRLYEALRSLKTDNVVDFDSGTVWLM